VPENAKNGDGTLTPALKIAVITWPFGDESLKKPMEHPIDIHYKIHGKTL